MASNQILGGTSIANGLPIYLPPQTEETLYGLFLDVCKKAVTQTVKEMYNPTERYVTQTQLVKMLQVGDQQVQEWRKQGLRRVKIGKTYRYDLQELFELLEKNKK